MGGRGFWMFSDASLSWEAGERRVLLLKAEGMLFGEGRAHDLERHLVTPTGEVSLRNRCRHLASTRSISNSS